MKTFIDCLPCFLKQTLQACRMVTADEAVHQRVARQVLEQASRWSFDRSPPEMGREIHRIIREETGNPDPYREVKERYNRFALELLPGLQKRVKASADPFQTAVRLAIAGNIIDFGVGSGVSEQQVLDTIEDALVRPLAVDHLEDLRRAAGNANEILFLGDNAGEIVLDRLLLEQLPPGKIIFGVRGFPVINDATRLDAQIAGLDEFTTVIDNGSDYPGTVLKSCSQDFQARFRRADLVIAKGQGNYETLSGDDDRIFCLLKVKCPIIARDIGCQEGEIVVKRLSKGRSMSLSTCSLVFDQNSASQAFPGVSVDKLVMALLATLHPEPDWEGGQLYSCPSPLDQENSACLVTRGPAAEVMQERLVQAMEKHGIVVIELFEGGPEPGAVIARVAQGRWQL